MNQINLPEKICAVIRRLADHGYHGYAVGGCVRDMLMGKEPHDFDITTDAFPSETSESFPDCPIILTGLKHGTVTVVYEGENIEITTFRTAGEYLDNRHPESVTFVRNIVEDLSRRDFTVNAMAYNPEEGLVDLFKGKDDIARKIIRCVGDADTRFNEDGLRILRAMRFASVLGFKVEEKTAESVVKNKKLLKNISVERIYSEFTKLISGDNAVSILKQFYEVLSELFGEIPAENIECLDYCPKEHTVRYAALFAHMGEETAGKTIRALKTDNDTFRLVKKLVGSLAWEIPKFGSERFEKEVAHLLAENSFDDFVKIISLRRAFEELRGEPADNSEKLLETAEKLVEGKACLSIKSLDVSGKELAKAGIPQSAEMGRILKELLRLVIEGEVENRCDALIERAKIL
ncbi:MAG: CCA tRNA nucleotidyltransferase [Clostridia bacterium]|nr:CCA tRNA nucleotidyltransferase [Clostridia bacterium]